MARPHRYMTRRYADELRLFRTRWARVGLVVAILMIRPYGLFGTPEVRRV